MPSDETGEAIDARARLVARARSYLGPNGEPRQHDPNEFFRIFAPMFADQGLERKKAWCGIFYGSLLALEGLWPAGYERWRDGSGFALRAVSDGHMRVTRFPRVGDLAIFGAPLWHHAMVVEPVARGLVQTVDGNVLGNLEGVAAETHAVTGATTFFSIAPLISEPAYE